MEIARYQLVGGRSIHPVGPPSSCPPPLHCPSTLLQSAVHHDPSSAPPARPSAHPSARPSARPSAHLSARPSARPSVRLPPAPPPARPSVRPSDCPPARPGLWRPAALDGRLGGKDSVCDSSSCPQYSNPSSTFLHPFISSVGLQCVS